MSEESGDEEHSDDEDVFKMKAATQDHLSDAYRNFWLYRWQLAEEEVTMQLRDEVLLPLDVNDSISTAVFIKVEIYCSATALALSLSRVLRCRD